MTIWIYKLNLVFKCVVLFVDLCALGDPSFLNKMWSRSSQRITTDTMVVTNG